MEIVTPLEKKVRIISTEKLCVISAEIRKNIAENWQKLVTLYPYMFNGAAYSVELMEETKEGILLTCSLTDYAHYRYSENHELGKEACRNVYGSCMVITKDGYVVVALNGSEAEFDGKIQAIGGGVEGTDKANASNELDPELTALRELCEETGEEIRNSILSTRPGYLLTNGRKFGIITLGMSSMTKDEMQQSFHRFQIESGNKEISKLLFFSKKELKELNAYEDRQDLGVVEMIQHCLSEFTLKC